MATDRDLLFGLLALQNGLISRDQLVAAFEAWTLDKSRMADHLEDRVIWPRLAGAAGGAGRGPPQAHGGDPEKSLAASRPHPPGEPRRRRRPGGRGDARPRRLGLDRVRRRPRPHVTLSVGTATSDGQRFRVLRPHAQGGLGAVFVALDGELNREVALKQILDHHADDPTSRQRFLIEAEITGGLEHPGIVPVYGLGTYGDGRPYYAMRFIRGDSLKEAIDAFHADERSRADPGRRSLALRKLLRRFIDVCNAIDYAHSRGVLHRDIKPGNVIVGKHGETLVVDWGLAKPLGKAEPASTDGRADVDAVVGQRLGRDAARLGAGHAGLHEPRAGRRRPRAPRPSLRRLQPRRHALLPADRQGRRSRGRPRRRSSARSSRATSRRPASSTRRSTRRWKRSASRRWRRSPRTATPTCRALAEDVERWAADEPVSAWREPSRSTCPALVRRQPHGGDGGRRRRVLVAVVGPGGPCWRCQSRANGALARPRTSSWTGPTAARTEANAEPRRGQRPGPGPVRPGPRGDPLVPGRGQRGRHAQGRGAEGPAQQAPPLGRRVLREARGLLQGQTDRPSRAILAQSYFELGDLTDKIGIKPEALAVHRKALAIRRELAARPEADADAKLDLARSLNADRLAGRGHRRHGRAPWRPSRKPAAWPGRWPTGPGATDAARDVLGTSHHADRSRPVEHGQAGRGAGVVPRGVGDPQSWPRTTPPSPNSAAAWRTATTTSASCRLRDRPAGRGAGSFRESLAIRRKLAEDNPAVTEFRSRLAISHNNIGDQQSQTGRHGRGVRVVSPSRWRSSRKLAEDNPAVTEFRNRLAVSHPQHRRPAVEAGQTDEALASYRVRWRSARSWPRTTPPSPNSVTFRRKATTDLAGSC